MAETVVPVASSAERKPGKRVIAFTIVLLVPCQSQQILATSGISLFLPLIRQDASLDFTQGGILAAASTLVYALMQIPARYLADRFGARRLFLVGLIGTSVLSLSFALLHVYWLLVLNQAISGFFRALLFAPGLLLINALFPSNRRAMAMGLYVAGGSSSNVLLNVVGPSLVGPLGWRVLFVLFSLMGLLIAVLYWRFGYQSGPTVGGKPLPLRNLLHLFQYPAMWLPGAIGVCAPGGRTWAAILAAYVCGRRKRVFAPGRRSGGSVRGSINRPFEFSGWLSLRPLAQAPSDHWNCLRHARAYRK